MPLYLPQLKFYRVCSFLTLDSDRLLLTLDSHRLSQDSILERMKAKAAGRQKAKPKIDGYDERS